MASNKRENIIDLQYGELRGLKPDGSIVTFINSDDAPSGGATGPQGAQGPQGEPGTGGGGSSRTTELYGTTASNDKGTFKIKYYAAVDPVAPNPVVTEKGVYLSTTPNPTDTNITISGGSEINIVSDSFGSVLYYDDNNGLSLAYTISTSGVGLSSSTLYYCRPFIKTTDEMMVSSWIYGPEVSFTTP